METTVLIIVIIGLTIVMVILAIAILIAISRPHKNYGPTIYYGNSKLRASWRSDIIALLTILVMIIGILFALLLPEVRGRLGLENQNTHPVTSPIPQ